MFKVVAVMTGLMLASAVQGQMPHEVLLLVNRQSQPSLKVANTYVATRGIPQRNIIYLDIPERIYGGTATISPADFTKLIWEPACEAAGERGIDQQILAWVYSVDFPIRVKTDDNDRRQMSVLGLTFLRNQVPDLDDVENGTYLSKLFAGPSARFQQILPSLSFRLYRDGVGPENDLPEEIRYLEEGLGDDMPLPSMMLGYIGEKGNDVETVLETIKQGARSDFRGLRDGIYFVTGDDVRSTCREWEFQPAVDELKERQITATVTTNFPAGKQNVLGLMMGAETVDPALIGSFAPGAMAEHLTSWSAEFQRPQTKMTAWLKAGATATAGSVVEPYSNSDKFPAARFFYHYTSGCTMLESFYQSIACPLQILLLGDPLARPYGPRISVRILGADTIEDDFTYVAKASSRITDLDYDYDFLLDGKPFKSTSDKASAWIPVNSISDGYHALRAIAKVRFTVEFGSSLDKDIMVERTGRSIEIDASRIAKAGEHKNTLGVKLGGEEQPVTVRLVCGEMVLDEKPYEEGVALELDELLIGEGPNRIQAIAVYDDGMQVAGPPLGITITFAK